MSKSRLTKPLITTLTTAAMGLLNPTLATAEENPFGMQVLTSGYMLADNTDPATATTTDTAPDPTSAPKHHHKGHHKHKNKHKHAAKIKEGTCASEHRKAMEGKCGGGAMPSPEPK